MLYHRIEKASALRGLCSAAIRSAAAVTVIAGGLAFAQTPVAGQAAPTIPTLPTTICGLPVPAPSRLPPPDSAPIFLTSLLCFEKQGGYPYVEPSTYVYYIQLTPRASSPSNDRWVRYDEQIEQVAQDDFRRLWATNFLDDLSVEVRDVRLANGVIGKVVVYNMEERQRVKIVDYMGNLKVDQNKIEERLKEKGIAIRLDSFVDQRTTPVTDRTVP